MAAGIGGTKLLSIGMGLSTSAQTFLYVYEFSIYISRKQPFSVRVWAADHPRSRSVKCIYECQGHMSTRKRNVTMFIPSILASTRPLFVYRNPHH